MWRNDLFHLLNSFNTIYYTHYNNHIESIQHPTQLLYSRQLVLQTKLFALSSIHTLFQIKPPLLKHSSNMAENLLTITNSVAKKPRNGDDIDRLSDLPDSILCHIISKLETREAVKTCLLSSRYKSLWMNITSLRFTYRRCGHHKVRFSHFVNRVLFALKSKSINNFFLKLDAPLEIYDASFWISAAIGMNVKVLKLHIKRGCVEHSISLPSCLYTSKTLELLELCVWSRINTVILGVPEFVSLPKLTKLRLRYVKYSSDDSARRFISGCSSLEYLCIGRNRSDGVTTFTINSPTLKTLYYYFLGSAKGSIEHKMKFELNAPALRHLEFCDNGSRDFSDVNLCLLKSAEIMVRSPRVVDHPESHYERVTKHLQGFFNVNHLWISGHTLEALSFAPSLGMDSGDSRLLMERKSLQDLFEHSTGVHELYLSKDSSDTTHVVRWGVLHDFPVFLPVCLLSYLETISVSGFRGLESELTMIAYILENAKVLRKMSISVATSEAEAEFRLREKVMKFNRGSTRCEITFS